MPPLGSNRRNGLGAPRSTAGAVPQRPVQQTAARGTGVTNDRPRSIWQTAATLYDPWHSSMEAQVVAEFYGAKFSIKIAPVYAERRGPDEEGQGKKYNHEEASMVVFSLPEAIVFKAQLEAFLNGQLTEVVIPRLETKRLVLAPSEVYYEPSHPEYKDHANGLVLAIEEDATEKSDGKNVIFISRQQVVSLSSDASVDPLAFFPELQALLAVLDSYVQNVARVDFASCRLLENRAQAEEKAAGPSVQAPVRRSTLAGSAPKSTPADSQPSNGSVTVSTTVTDNDIDSALDSATTAALDDVLGQTPEF
jgi:hypothetical protein